MDPSIVSRRRKQFSLNLLHTKRVCLADEFGLFCLASTVVILPVLLPIDLLSERIKDRVGYELQNVSSKTR